MNHIIDKGMGDQAMVDALDAKAKKMASESVKFAKESPDTPMSEMYTDIYAEPYGPPFLKGDMPDIVTNPNCE